MRLARTPPGPLALAWAAIGFAFLAWAVHGALQFPVHPHAIAATLVVYAIAGLLYPGLWLVVVPAALPILTLTLWSGRLFVTELDFLLAASLGFALIRHGASLRGIDRHFAALLVALLGYNIWVTANGFHPPEPGGLGAWNDLLSSYNALREARGPLWAVAFLPVLVAHRRRGIPVQRLFALGMVAGVLTVSGTILWERWIFTGLFDTTTPYRVSGLFFNMVTGGAAIDSYLALTSAFVAVLLLRRDRHWLQALGALMAILVAYCFFVTYSRTNYLAGGVIVLTLVGGLLIMQFRRHPGGLPAHSIPVALAATVALFGVVGVAASQGYIAERFRTVQEDFAGRVSHWQSALDLLGSRDGGWLVGAGRGVFPLETFWQHSVDDPLTAPTRTTDRDEAFLSFRPGADDSSVYLRQRIVGPVDGPFRLQMTLRAPEGNSERILVEFCARHILRFRDECPWGGITIPAGTTDWTTFNKRIDLGSLPTGAVGPFRRPVDIAVMTRGIKSRIDIAAVQLYRDDGMPVLDNAEFEQGLDHWFFSYGDHLRWHIKNLPVHVLFEGGILGIAVVGWFVIGAVVRLGRRVTRGQDHVALAMLAALAGTLVVGIFDSVIDAPRIGFLLTLLLLLGWLRTDPTRHDSSPATGNRPA